MTKFRHQFDPKYKGEKGVINELDSMTKPDQNMSIAQLLVNHTRGIASNVRNHEGVYTMEEEVPKFVDITEQREHLKGLQERKKMLDKQIKDEQADIKKKQHEQIEEKLRKEAEEKASKKKKEESDT